MQLLIDSQRKRAVSSLKTDGDLIFPQFSNGEVVPIAAAVVDQITSLDSTNQRFWEPVDMGGWQLRIAIGNGFIQPKAGSFTLTFDGNTTSDIPYNASAQNVEDALNLLDSIILSGGVDVTGENGFFYISWRLNGMRSLLGGDAGDLAPLSIVEVMRTNTGDTDKKDVQLIRILQNPGALADLTTDTAPTTGVIDYVQTGGGGHNAKFRITFDPLPYDGSWSLIYSGEESKVVAWNVSESDLQAALEEMAVFGAGNVSVNKEQEGIYLVGLQGDLANTGISSVDIDESGLRTVIFRTGNLDLRTPGITALLGTTGTAQAIMEVEAVPAGGYPTKIMRANVTLVQSVIEELAMVPTPIDEFYTKPESDARFLSSQVMQGVVYVNFGGMQATTGYGSIGHVLTMYDDGMGNQYPRFQAAPLPSFPSNNGIIYADPSGNLQCSMYGQEGYVLGWRNDGYPLWTKAFVPDIMLDTVTGNQVSGLMTFKATKLYLFNSSGAFNTVLNFNKTARLTNPVGAGGLDAGTVAANTWYYVYAVSDAGGGLNAILLSTNVNAPSFANAATYSYYVKIGAVRTDASSVLIDFGQAGNYVATDILANTGTTVPSTLTNMPGFTGSYPAGVCKSIDIRLTASFSGHTNTGALIVSQGNGIHSIATETTDTQAILLAKNLPNFSPPNFVPKWQRTNNASTYMSTVNVMGFTLIG